MQKGCPLDNLFLDYGSLGLWEFGIILLDALSHCLIFPLSHCPIFPLSHCPIVPLSRTRQTPKEPSSVCVAAKSYAVAILRLFEVKQKRSLLSVNEHFAYEADAKRVRQMTLHKQKREGKRYSYPLFRNVLFTVSCCL